jgi:hypothetical protein
MYFMYIKYKKWMMSSSGREENNAEDVWKAAHAIP